MKFVAFVTVLICPFMVLAQGPDCSTPKNSIPGTCPARPEVGFLKNPGDCGSCAIVQNNKLKPDSAKDIHHFVANDPAGGAICDANDKPSVCNCLNLVKPKRGESVLTREWVRRRFLCIDQGEFVKTAADVDLLIENAKRFAQEDERSLDLLRQEGLDPEQVLKEHALDYGSKQMCQSGVKTTFGSTSSGHGQILTDLSKEYYSFTTDEERQNFLKDQISKVRLRNLKNGFFCSGTPKVEKGDRKALNLGLDISFNAEEFFGNSSAKIQSPEQLKLKVREELQKKIKNNPALKDCAVELESIDTSASANKLGNSGNYKRWDFKQLALDRAHAVDQLVMAEVERSYPKSENFRLNPPTLGNDGQGTAGDCPYELVPPLTSGVRDDQLRSVVLKKEYQDHRSVSYQALEKEKKVEIALHFKVPGSCGGLMSISNEVSFRHQGCMQIHLDCR